MAVIIKKLVFGSQLTTSAANYYTCPSNTKTVIKKMTFTNTGANSRLVSVYLVPSAGSASNSNAIAINKALGPYEIWDCEGAGHSLEAGQSIQALADAGSEVTIQVSGIETTG